jgi:hypothetical protein
VEILGKGRGDKWVGWDLKVIGGNFKGEGKGKVGLGFIIIIPRYYFLGLGFRVCAQEYVSFHFKRIVYQ